MQNLREQGQNRKAGEKSPVFLRADAEAHQRTAEEESMGSTALPCLLPLSEHTTASNHKREALNRSANTSSDDALPRSPSSMVYHMTMPCTASAMTRPSAPPRRTPLLRQSSREKVL